MSEAHEIIRQGDGLYVEEEMWEVNLEKLFELSDVVLTDEEVTALAQWIDAAIASDRSAVLWDALREKVQP